VLSPLRLELNPADFKPGSGAGLEQPPYTTHVVLTDGGVYDNLGLETAWKKYQTVLVSDGGGHMLPEPHPHTDWALHALRINDLIDNQVRDLRQRQLIASFNAKPTDPNYRTGTYWATRSDISNYGLPGTLQCPLSATQEIAAVPTRLARIDERMQDRLINWGYAICDAAMRRHVVTETSSPPVFPYPGGV
jgi:NTE family protein